MERKLASVQKIVDIQPIANADKIEVATVEGWKVVVKKGEYKIGDKVIFAQIDSFIPNSLAPFLTKSGSEPRLYNGVLGERLKTIKLKQQISQGLILPLPKEHQNKKEGTDLTEILGIIKYESESDKEQNAPAKRSAFIEYLFKNKFTRRLAKKLFLPKKENGSWPTQIYRTDEERIQNLTGKFNHEWKGTEGWYVTEKMEGQSSTYFSHNVKALFGRKKKFGVCSRNTWKKTKDNSNWWQVALKYDLEKKLNSFPFDVYIQGEICGPGIQGNIYKLKELKLFVFNLVINGKNTHNVDIIQDYCKNLGLEMVPVINHDFTLPQTIEEVITMADGKSTIADTAREGLLFRKEGISFKSVSNQYLMNQK
jgi:tRNA-binding EMAP/Myf-like protein